MPERNLNANPKWDGSKAIIAYNGKILILKRRNVPFIANPGIWSFVGGGHKPDETYLETAYRETFEEVGIKKSDLRLIGKKKMLIRDVRNEKSWWNMIFAFVSKTNKVNLGLENAKYEWVGFNELKVKLGSKSEFVDNKTMLALVKKVIRISLKS